MFNPYDSQTAKFKASLIDIGNLIIFDNESNLFVEKSSGRILNPLIDEVQDLLEERDDVYDTMTLVNDCISSIKSPNYYIIEDSSNDVTFIEDDLDYCNKIDRYFFVCHSCEGRVLDIEDARDHSKSCKKRKRTSFDISVYQGGYSLMMHDGGKIRKHHLIVSGSFKKFLSLDEFEKGLLEIDEDEEETQNVLSPKSENEDFSDSEVDGYADNSLKISPLNHKRLRFVSDSEDDSEEESPKKKLKLNETPIRSTGISSEHKIHFNSPNLILRKIEDSSNDEGSEFEYLEDDKEAKETHEILGSEISSVYESDDRGIVFNLESIKSLNGRILGNVQEEAHKELDDSGSSDSFDSSNGFYTPKQDPYEKEPITNIKTDTIGLKTAHDYPSSPLRSSKDPIDNLDEFSKLSSIPLIPTSDAFSSSLEYEFEKHDARENIPIKTLSIPLLPTSTFLTDSDSDSDGVK